MRQLIEIFNNFQKDEKKDFLFVFFLMFAIFFFEFLGIGLLYPVISFIIKEDFIDNFNHVLIINSLSKKEIILLSLLLLFLVYLVKNIIAVFCGIITQLKMGKNIEAAFISKILQNLNQFIDFDKTTLVQPAGIGDLFLSCSSIKSRNYSFGINLILNRKIEFDKLVEGYNSLNNLKSSKNIKLISDLDHIIQEIVNHSNQETICNLIINLINTI